MSKRRRLCEMCGYERPIAGGENHMRRSSRITSRRSTAAVSEVVEVVVDSAEHYGQSECVDTLPRVLARQAAEALLAAHAQLGRVADRRSGLVASQRFEQQRRQPAPASERKRAPVARCVLRAAGRHTQPPGGVRRTTAYSGC